MVTENEGVEKERLSRCFVVLSECENSPGREKEGERKKRGSQGRSINKAGGRVRKGAKWRIRKRSGPKKGREKWEEGQKE